MEEFETIKNFENYWISNYGNVMNEDTGEILKPFINKQGYYKVNLYNNQGRFTKIIHRLVAEAFIPNPNNKKCVDHIDNDKLNNNVENLRWATCQENNFNRKLNVNNTTGIKGVCKTNNKWKAYISYNGKDYYLGLFKTKEEAIEARLNASKKYFGEYMNKCEKELTINIKLPKKTKLKLNINIVDDEYEELEKEFEKLL
jgi:hypothetical protein